jgi:hypothetical protein
VAPLALKPACSYMVNMSVMEASVFREAKPLNLNLYRQQIIPTAFSIPASGDRTARRADAALDEMDVAARLAWHGQRSILPLI